MENNENSSGENLYKWAIRSMYTLAIGLNVWYMANAFKNTPEGEIAINKIRDYAAKVRHPFNEEKRIKRMEAETVVEAWIVVDEAKKESDSTNDGE